MSNKFDDIIKSQLESIQVDPTKRTRRILGFKLFFLNLLQFHKVKVAVGVSAVAIASAFFFLNISQDDAKKESVANNTEKQQLNKQNEEIAETNTNKDLLNASEQQGEDDIVEKQNTNAVDESEDISNSVKSDDKDKLISGNESFEASSNLVKDKESNSDSKLVTPSVEKNKRSNQEVKNVIHEDRKGLNNSDNGIARSTDELKSYNDKQENDQRVANESFNTSNNQKQIDEHQILANVLQPNFIASDVEGELSSNVPPFEMNEDDYANNPKTRGISIDAYYTAINNTKINNSIQDGSVYYWDFYKKQGFANSGMKGGLNVNYMYNGFKFGTGLGYNQINEIRPNYKYVYDTTTFVPFGGYTVSGTMVYEQDTTLILYTPHTKDVTDAFSSNNNQYRYITIPISLGYEVYLGKWSFEANAGILYQRLIGASGLSVKVENFENEAKNIFYYKDRYMTTMADNKRALNKNLVNMNLNFITRFKISSHLDLLGGVNYGTSINTIYVKNYFVSKQVQNFGINFGVTYHINERL